MERSWVDRLADDLAASRAELVGLALLLVGGIALAVAVVGQVPDPARGALAASAIVEHGGAVLPSSPPSPTPVPIVVHVTGAVRAPKVVDLPPGARLVDAVDAAGGPRGDADLDVLNLAQVLGDGQRLHVPTQGEVAAALALDGAGDAASSATGPPAAPVPSWGVGPTGSGDGAGGGVRAAGDDALLDLNLVDAVDLEALPGLGPVLAGRIIAWRDEHGAFDEVGQLRDVNGIGEARFQDLAPLVTVS